MKKQKKTGFVLNKLTIAAAVGIALVLVIVWGVFYWLSSNDFAWLEGDDIESVISNNVADHTDPSYQAKNLVDGNSRSRASPFECGPLDYTIQLKNKYKIDKVELIWRDQGTTGVNVQEWSLEAETGNNQWELIIEKKEAPMEEVTTVNANVEATAIRLKAASHSNQCISVYEVKLFGALADK